MTLRTYFDMALNPKASPEDRERAFRITVITGQEAKLHIEQAKDSLRKLRAKQAQRRAK